MGGERGIEPSCGAASMPTVSTPTPTRAFFGDQRTHSASKPGEWGLPSVALRNASGSRRRRPARVQEQPASFGEWSVVVFEGAYVFDGEQVVGVTGGFGGTVDHDRGGDEVAGRHLRDVVAVAAADPVYGRVEVGACMLADSSQDHAHAGPRSS